MSAERGRPRGAAGSTGEGAEADAGSPVADGATRHGIELDLPATHRAVRVGRNVVRRFARLLGIANQEVDYLALIVSELLANAVDHGGGGAAMVEDDLGSDVRMKLGFAADAAGWRLTVTDQGGGDPEEVRRILDGGRMPDLEDDRGRGLLLLAQMVDEMTVERSPSGRGLTFRARRRLTG